MDNLEYSAAALDTLQRFHGVKHVIFVEGPEDIRFWTCVFEQFSLASYKLKASGGKETLKRYADAIVSHGASVYAVMDLDHSDLDGTGQSHSRVFYTYGYSIENSLCYTGSISEAVSNLSCSDHDVGSEYENWLQEMLITLTPLIACDIANMIEGSGMKVPLTNIARFQDGSRRHTIGKSKVSTEVSKLKPRLKSRHIAAAELALSSPPKTVFWRVRGHFLISACMSFTRYQVYRLSRKRISLSHEAFLAILLGQFRVDRCDPNERDHLQRITEEIQKN